MTVSLGMRLEAAAARGALALLRALGPVRASNFGGAVARGIGGLLSVSRVADANLRRAMPELSAAERRRIVLGVWENLGRTVGELPHIASLRQNTPSGPGWEMVGEETLIELAAKGGPAIFVSGHIGNWEMLPPAVAAYGMPFSSMYRAAANPLIDEMIVALRRQAIGADVPMFPKGAAGARGALAHMARGGYLGMLMDQKMNDGIEARFFGRPAMTAPALAALALRFRCPVILGHVERIGPARFRLICEKPLPLPDSGDRQADIRQVTQQVNDALERWIRERPESWLWLHRRWPKSDG
jgi:Kdo2-lipid IVA lauroyltransferase/acyltransferase